MHKGGMRTTVLRIGRVSSPLDLARWQTSAASSLSSAISTAPINPQFRTCRTPGNSANTSQSLPKLRNFRLQRFKRSLSSKYFQARKSRRAAERVPGITVAVEESRSQFWAVKRLKNFV